MEATQMDASATQTGAEVSIEDRILAHLDEEEESPDVETSVDEETTSKADEADDTLEEETETLELDASTLAKIHGLDESDIFIDEDGKPYIKTKVDGEEGRATLEDLRKSYQLESSVNKRSMQLAEKQKQFESYAQESLQNIEYQSQQANQLLNMAENELLQQYQSINWQELRMSDPAEYSALQTEFNNRNAQIQQAKHQAVVTYQQQQQQIQQERNRYEVESLQAENNKLMELLPSWRDEKTAQREKGQLIGYLQQEGFTEAEIGAISRSAKAIQVLHRDMMRSQSKPEIKKVKKSPKVTLKSGSTKTQAEADTRKMQAKRNQLKKSGSVHDLASLLIDRI